MTSAFRVLLGAVLLLGLAAASRTAADPDLWGHLRFGLDALHDRALSSVDPYSFTQDRPWVNHEWLSELQMGVAWVLAGTAGLALLKGGLVLAGLWLIWQALAGAALPARLGAMAFAVVATFPLLQTIRPQLWTFVLLAVLCRMLAQGAGFHAWHYAVLFAVWANVHGGWIVGLGVVGLWSAPDVLAGRVVARRAVTRTVSAIVATLFTPYGWTLWMFLAETVRLGRPRIEEWQPIWTVAPGAAIIWSLVVAASLWLVRDAVPDRFRRGLVVAVLAIAGFRVARMTPLFAEAAMMFLAPAIAARWPARGEGIPDPSPSDRPVALVLATAVFVGALYVGRTSLTCITVDRSRMPDAEAIALLASARPGRLVTFFNWGQYALWHVGPEVRVSMDGRRETVYSDARLADHDAVLAGTAEGLRTLLAWAPDYVWLPNEAVAARARLEAEGYRVEYVDRLSFIAVRPDLPALATSPVPSERAECFPD